MGSRFRARPLRLLCGLAVLGAVVSAAAPARAYEVKIGIGYGLAFLPAYICEDLKLVEKYAREAHLDVKASYPRFAGAGPMQEAIASGEIDMAPFGTVPLLRAWDTKDKARQILVVSGLTTLPLLLLSDQPSVHSIADLKMGDRIGMPTLTAPQMYVLEMQSEKTFGQYDRLSGQVLALPPGDAIKSLIDGEGPVTADFSSPPFSQIALKNTKIHAILSSEDVIKGKGSFLILGATRRYIDAHAKIPQVIDQAMDEAARLIHDDPSRAARIYLAHEPSKALNAADIAAVLTDEKDEFGSAVQGIQVFTDFLARHDELKSPPKSWKDIVAPALLNSPSS